MKIGFFYVPYYPLGISASIHGFYLVKALKKRGHTILSCLGEGNPECIQFERTKWGALKLANASDVLYIRIAGNPGYGFLEKATLLKLLRPFSLPVVWEVNAPVEEVKASISPGKKCEELIQRENRKRKLLAPLADAGIGVSEVLKNYVREFLGIKKAYCIPNASDPCLFEPHRVRETALVHLKATFKIFWIGNARTPWQGIELMLDIAEKMQHIDKSIIFVLITGDSLWRFPVLSNLLIFRHVHYSDLPHYLASADLCLCLYKSYKWCEYGFYNSPLKLFDYMAAGKPIIASAMGQMATVIRQGVNGILVDNDVSSIIATIRELKEDRARREYLGGNARNDVVNFYNWDRVAQQTEEVLREVCGR